MKNTNLKFGKKGYFRSLTAMLALVTTLSGCSFGNQDLTQDDLESTVVIENTTEVVPEQDYEDISDYEETTDYEIENEVEEDKEEEVQSGQSTNEVRDSFDFSKVTFDENLIIPDLSKSEYKGLSIVDALLFEKYPATAIYRAQLAKYFGIDNYNRLADQNTLLLHYLRTWNAIIENKIIAEESTIAKFV